MAAQRQKPIDFAAEGLCLALSVNRKCGTRVYLNTSIPLTKRTIICSTTNVSKSFDLSRRIGQYFPTAGSIPA
jgi:hypothetical protein